MTNVPQVESDNTAVEEIHFTSENALDKLQALEGDDPLVKEILYPEICKNVSGMSLSPQDAVDTLDQAIQAFCKVSYYGDIQLPLQLGLWLRIPAYANALITDPVSLQRFLAEYDHMFYDLFLKSWHMDIKKFRREKLGIE
ncbi:MAG: hypothetical protein UR96_C0028G0002 [candidate division WS6 bacterium GW2011_GWC1_36_11]|uniref:Uncharacterized protein n=1 Tax=candidate division WS6 bacterium GW2011_GWC1_36_11 TaxID=1619090 RepID=A0A0G0GJD4_9BACT|nr:MAG: hypothetical protein UR96_C0028G0002 [candidate division WS6 bacterium GW2011_GWC1_36_11]HAM37159.1 hypothetical protein [Patescibacteria group bacterium]